jgi:hypothetical protein
MGDYDIEEEVEEEIEHELEEEIDNSNIERDEDLDASESDADSIVGKKERIQMINHDIKKLLEERDELERQILDLEDDLEDRRV